MSKVNARLGVENQTTRLFLIWVPLIFNYLLQTEACLCFTKKKKKTIQGNSFVQHLKCLGQTNCGDVNKRRLGIFCPLDIRVCPRSIFSFFMFIIYLTYLCAHVFLYPEWLSEVCLYRCVHGGGELIWHANP